MKKKGFTLIELLAVIVILAVIALIVTPIVTGIIKSAKEQANARSVEGHVKNIENAIILNAFARAGDMKAFDNKTKTEIEALVTAENDLVTCSSYTILNGTVQSAEGCTVTGWSKTYTYTIGNGAVVEAEPEVVVFNGTYVAPGEDDTYLGIVYMDPTDVSTLCTPSATALGTGVNCRKFYIYDDTDDTYRMIMDSNLVDSYAYVDKDVLLEKYFTEDVEDVGYGYTNTCFVHEPSSSSGYNYELVRDWVYEPGSLSVSDVARMFAEAEERGDYDHASYWWLVDGTDDCNYFSDGRCDLDGWNRGYRYTRSSYWLSDTVYHKATSSWPLYYENGNFQSYGFGEEDTLYDGVYSMGVNYNGPYLNFSGCLYEPGDLVQDNGGVFYDENEEGHYWSFSSTTIGLRPVIEIPKTLIGA